MQNVLFFNIKYWQRKKNIWQLDITFLQHSHGRLCYWHADIDSWHTTAVIFIFNCVLT